jgi:hypothetical protein
LLNLKASALLKTFLKIFDFIRDLKVNIWVGLLQIVFGIGIALESICIGANLLTVATLLKHGMGAFSGYYMTYYILFLFIPFTILLVLSSLYTYLVYRIFWSAYKKAYYYLFLVMLISFTLLPLSFYICSNCRE